MRDQGRGLCWRVIVAAAALLLSTVFGVLLGIVIASPRHASGWFGLRAVLAFLASIPGFWLGIGLIMVFGERLRILPVAGLGHAQRRLAAAEAPRRHRRNRRHALAPH